MHKKTSEIIKNLGFTQRILDEIKEKLKNPVTKKTLNYFTDLGVPKLALKQIKYFEETPEPEKPKQSNKELIETLVKKCRRSFNAFAKKQVKAKIVFKNNKWLLYSTSYNKNIQRLHEVCKIHFDDWADQGVVVSFTFNGTTSWKISALKKSDLPKN